jgi:hypothetical protein
MSMTVDVATAGAVFERQRSHVLPSPCRVQERVPRSFHAEPVRIRQQTALP